MGTTRGARLGRPALIRAGALAGSRAESIRLVVAVRRLRDEVGRVPKIELTAGLRETVEWWTQEAS